MAGAMATNDGEAALRAGERDWTAAAQRWDCAALAALYTEDAVFYGGRVGHSVGRSAIRAYFESYAALFTSVRLALVEQELRALRPDCWLAQGYAAFDFDMRDGGSSQAKLRSTLVLVKRAEGWRILQHHFSATPAVPPI
jgi:uncharacterized protein (TIGR02246 family)